MRGVVLHRSDHGGGKSTRFFNTEEAGRPTENHGAERKLRFARSALNPYSVASVVLPSSSVLKVFLNCRQHMFPRLSEATAIQAIALGQKPGAAIIRWLLPGPASFATPVPHSHTDGEPAPERKPEQALQEVCTSSPSSPLARSALLLRHRSLRRSLALLRPSLAPLRPSLAPLSYSLARPAQGSASMPPSGRSRCRRVGSPVPPA